MPLDVEDEVHGGFDERGVPAEAAVRNAGLDFLPGIGKVPFGGGGLGEPGGGHAGLEAVAGGLEGPDDDSVAFGERDAAAKGVHLEDKFGGFQQGGEAGVFGGLGEGGTEVARGLGITGEFEGRLAGAGEGGGVAGVGAQGGPVGRESILVILNAEEEIAEAQALGGFVAKGGGEGDQLGLRLALGVDAEQVVDEFEARLAAHGFLLGRPDAVDGVVVVAEGLLDVLVAGGYPGEFEVDESVFGLAFPEVIEVRRSFVDAAETYERFGEVEAEVVAVAGIEEGDVKLLGGALEAMLGKVGVSFVEPVDGERLLLGMVHARESADGREADCGAHAKQGHDYGFSCEVTPEV